MKFIVKYNNVEAEFEAETKEEIWAAEKLFKTAAYTFREDEIKTSLNMYNIANAKGGKPQATNNTATNVVAPRKPVPVDPNGPATENQIRCLKARHISFDPSITKAEAFDLIQKNVVRHVK